MPRIIRLQLFRHFNSRLSRRKQRGLFFGHDMKRGGVVCFDTSKFQPLTILKEMTPTAKKIFSIKSPIRSPVPAFELSITLENRLCPPSRHDLRHLIRQRAPETPQRVMICSVVLRATKKILYGWKPNSLHNHSDVALVFSLLS
jgi:hypothetical protein